MSVKGAVVIVTGGASGIGHAVAEHLAEQGARVVIGDVAGAPQAAQALAARGLSASGVQVDVVDPAQVAAMVEHAESLHGRLDVLVNNAGIYSSLVPKPFDQLTVQEWRRVLARDMYPADLVGAVAFFAGSGAQFITGQTLVVDGGAYFH